VSLEVEELKFWRLGGLIRASTGKWYFPSGLICAIFIGAYLCHMNPIFFILIASDSSSS
jgi:hypothetical protein